LSQINLHGVHALNLAAARSAGSCVGG